MSDVDALVWVDMEMTGLDPEKERIIEVAVLITNGQIEIRAEGPNLAIHQPEGVLAAMDDWNKRHHGESGLLDRVRASAESESSAEEKILAFVAAHCGERMAPLAGNSIHQDRRFIQRYMPRLDAYLHYRNVDVSTVKELVRRWYPTVFEGAPKKQGVHRALDDIRESITELQYYRQHAFRAV
jgi:oligoribonuclease